MMLKEIKIPDIGGAENVDVIEILVAPGDKVQKEDSLIVLEGDKATMEIPSPETGVIESIAVKTGDKVSQGHVILTLKVGAGEAAPSKETSEKPKEAPAQKEATPALTSNASTSGSVGFHASPMIRRMARELDIDLSKVCGTAEKGRISKQDLQDFIKQQLQQSGSGSFSLPTQPAIDFSKFGEIEARPLNKIKLLTGQRLHQSWITVPHVTQFAEADITELENFRQLQKNAADKKGVKLTPIVFVMKAVVDALKAFPQFNASLDVNSKQLILKKYFHIGVAVDTPNGLVVPVIRDVDQKGLFALAKELGEISLKAREKGLSPQEMSGGCFTISSLGGIGGTAFTPIVNMPEVAILGLSRSSMKPVYQDGQFVPKLMLPLCLSYDHRVIDGAEGARFIEYLSSRLEDIRTCLL